jgi:hypothetical protein
MEFHDQLDDCLQFNKHFSVWTRWVRRIIRPNIQWVATFYRRVRLFTQRVGDRSMIDNFEILLVPRGGWGVWHAIVVAIIDFFHSRTPSFVSAHVCLIKQHQLFLLTYNSYSNDKRKNITAKVKSMWANQVSYNFPFSQYFITGKINSLQRSIK